MTKITFERKLDKVLNTLASLENLAAKLQNNTNIDLPQSDGASRGPKREATAPVLKLVRNGETDVLTYARGTALFSDDDGNYIGGAALCSDGEVRKLTWIGKVTGSDPVSTAVKVDGKTVSGFLVLEPAHSLEDAPALKFVTNGKGKYSDALPKGTFQGRRASDRKAS